MSASLILIVVMAVLYASGIYLMLERSMTRVLVGFLLVGNATNLLILIVAGAQGAAPLVDGETTAGEMSDPLPQALVLTAIVITFAVTAFLLALIYRSWRLSTEGEDDMEDDVDDIAMREGEGGVTAEQLEEIDSDTEFEVPDDFETPQDELSADDLKSGTRGEEKR